MRVNARGARKIPNTVPMSWNDFRTTFRVLDIDWKHCPVFTESMKYDSCPSITPFAYVAYNATPEQVIRNLNKRGNNVTKATAYSTCGEFPVRPFWVVEEKAGDDGE